MGENCRARGYRRVSGVWVAGWLAAALFCGRVASAAEAAGTLPETERQAVARELTAIWTLDPSAAAARATALQGRRGGLAAVPGSTPLLAAAALERSGDLRAAGEAYRSAGEAALGSPFAISAVYRIRLLELPSHSPQVIEKFFRQIASEREVFGWFQPGGSKGGSSWEWDSSHRVAWRGMADLHSSQISFAIFDFLNSWMKATAGVPPQYAWFWALAALSMAIKILEMPLLWRSALTTVRMRGLQGEVSVLQDVWGSDPVRLNQETMALYSRKGVNLFGGCLGGTVDIIFVIWCLLALRSYAPQFALDGARLGATDVTQPQLLALGAWGGLSLLAILLNPIKQPGQGPAVQMLGGLVMIGAFCAVAWWLAWPAYVFVFWALLTILGIIVQPALIVLREATQ